MSRMSIRTKLAAVAATGVMALGTGILAAGPAQASPADCPSGYVCIYGQDAGWNGIIWKANQAGTYNLSNMNGNHVIYNNQTGGWKFWTCTGYGGSGCSTGYLPAGNYMVKDLTPINSVKITP
ncbi:peptidase inhibitor family I36 protein [Streptomyces sp. NPDC060048]|uniref:peptidase inhibitor family I36 protein n=1 Tax=unclassified Streptomyces TaxID=2593676 RepID=UPI0036C24216